MPRFDFECPEHGEFEAAVSFKDADKSQPCPVQTGTGGGCKERGHRASKSHVHTIYPLICRRLSKRVARLYAANIKYCDGMTKQPAEVDSYNTRKYGHTV